MTKFKMEDLKRLHALGFALHWLKPRSKAPVNSGWTKAPRSDWPEFEKAYRKGYNVGVRLGQVSFIATDIDFDREPMVKGGYLSVIDVDVKSIERKHRKEAWDKLKELFPEAYENSPRVVSGRGNGSAHFYVLTSEPVRGNERKGQSVESVKVEMPSVEPSAKELRELTVDEIASGIRIRPAWEISLMSEGRQVVLPGSIHPDSGEPYRWEGTDRIFDATKYPVIAAHSAMSAASNPNPATQALGKKRYRFIEVNPRRLGLRKDQVEGIVSGEGVEDRSAFAFSIAMALFKRGKSDDLVISLLTDREFFIGHTGFDHAKTSNRHRAAYWIEKYCVLKAREKTKLDVFDEVEEITDEVTGEKKKVDFKEGSETLHSSMGFEEEWQLDLDLQKAPNGAPPTVKATFKNVRLILENEVGEELLKRNLFANEDFWNLDTPWGYEAGRKRSGNVDDALRVKAWLIDSEYKVEAAVNTIDEVLNYFATENSFHPVKDYLESLEWDGVERVEEAFATYLGAEMPDEYQREVCRKFFIALIKRIYEPGCKFDHVTVLEGKQGIGKSTFARYLVSDEWFMDGLPDFQDKDAALNLQGIWICELSELATIYRSANEQAKAFITRQTDKVRPPYGHRRVDLPRSTVFLGTTNARDYLTDQTGNRRFWPVEIERCDFEAVKADRDQLLAEAFFLYKHFPEPLYLAGKALKDAEAIQESRRLEDESDAMGTRFTHWVEGDEDTRQGFDLSELHMNELFESGPFRLFQPTMTNRRNAGLVLRRAGYHKVKGRTGVVWRPEDFLED